jgi:hypothetical protein
VNNLGKANNNKKGQKINWCLSSLLTDEDRGDGFSVTANCQHVILLKLGKQVARFSRSLSPQVIRAFIELVKVSERTVP